MTPAQMSVLTAHSIRKPLMAAHGGHGAPRLNGSSQVEAFARDGSDIDVVGNAMIRLYRATDAEESPKSGAMYTTGVWLEAAPLVLLLVDVDIVSR